MRTETTTNAKSIYQKALEKWGEIPQLDMLQEECAELIQAVSKIKRQGKMPFKTALHDNLASEIADVRIMCAQIEEMFKLGEAVDYQVEYKLLRLEQRLEEVK